MDAATFSSLCEYMGFTDQSSAVLAGLSDIVEPEVDAIVDDFYGAIEARPDARVVITGGREQIDRLKATLRAWLRSTFAGPHDLSYLEARSRIGRVHVRIDLPQQFMFGAVQRIRSQLVRVVERHDSDAESRSTRIRAINQVLDLELAIMLDTYRDDLVARKRASERLATIGELAASIGHELRNPLGVVESSLYLIEQHKRSVGLEDTKLDKHHDKIARQVRECASTITDLLELARDREPRKTKVALPAAVAAAKERANLDDGMVVEITSGADAELHADPEHIALVLSNLLSNARAACNGRGTVCISARSDRGGTAIRVEDDGPGVPVEIRYRIFDALFTTRPRGTGLGLALCRRLVEAHGGEIRLAASDRGAAFDLWLPDVASSGRSMA